MKALKQKEFARILKRKREERGVTQQQVADALLLSRSAYAYYETSVSVPTAEFVIRVSKILGINYCDLMEAVYADEFNVSYKAPKSSNDNEVIYRITNDEQNILLAYRNLDIPDREKKILSFIYHLNERRKVKQ